MARGNVVPRPAKKHEYTLRFASTNAEKGWRDLAATIRNPLADTFDFLTATPLLQRPDNYPLKDRLGTVARDGKTYDRWQHKPTLKGDARVWFYVDQKTMTVYIEQVHTTHPNETK